MQEVHLSAETLARNGKVREEGRADKGCANGVTAVTWWLSPSVGL